MCTISFFLSFKRALAENCSPRNESVEAQLLHKLKKKKKTSIYLSSWPTSVFLILKHEHSTHSVNVLCSPSYIKLVLFFVFVYTSFRRYFFYFFSNFFPNN